MKRLLDRVFVWSLVGFLIVHFMAKTFKYPFLESVLSFFVAVAFLTIFPFLTKKALVMPLIIIGISSIILFYSAGNLSIFWSGLREMREIIPVVLLVPLMGWIVGYKPYVQELLGIGQGKIRSSTQLYSLTSGISHFISSFMTIGGIPFVYQLFNGEKKSQVEQLAWDFTLSTAIMRGFALTVLWTTVHPAFAYVIAGTEAPLFSTMVKGFGLSFIGLFLGGLIYYFQFKKMGMNPSFFEKDQLIRNNVNWRVVLDFGGWVVTLIALIFMFYSVFKFEILLTIPLVIFIVTLFYYICNNDFNKYLQLWKKMITVDLKKKKREILLIISAGLLVSTLKQTGSGEKLFELFLTLIDAIHLDLLIGLSIIVILLGFCGLPPIPAMVLLSGILVNIPEGYSQELISLSLLLGVSTTLIIAPITVPLLMMSSQNGRSLYQNGFSWNIIFGITFLIVGQIYIQLLRM